MFECPKERKKYQLVLHVLSFALSDLHNLILKFFSSEFSAREVGKSKK